MLLLQKTNTYKTEGFQHIRWLAVQEISEISAATIIWGKKEKQIKSLTLQDISRHSTQTLGVEGLTNSLAHFI